MTPTMLRRSETNQGAGRLPSPTWVGLGLLLVGIVVEGSVTGTAYENRFPSAALAGWFMVLAGVGLMLLGYQRQLTRAGLPSNPAFFLGATLGTVALVVGWAALRGAVHNLDDSLRNGLVNAGVPVGALGIALAAVAHFRWLWRLNQEQQAVHWQMTWAFLRLFLPALCAAAAVSVVGWFWLRASSG
jgi:hypothetical protein